MSYKNIFQKPIKYLKGLNSKKICLFNKELNIYTYKDLLLFYPNGYIYTSIRKISELSIIHKDNYYNYVQIIGKIVALKKCNNNIFIALLQDSTGYIELVWFQKIFLFKNFKINTKVIVTGKLTNFQNKIQIIHPKIKVYHQNHKIYNIYPIYQISKNLNKNGINNNLITKLLEKIISEFKNKYFIKNFLFHKVIDSHKIISKNQSIIQIHFPDSKDKLLESIFYLKFEELFLLKIFSSLKKRKLYRKPFLKIGKNFNFFYNNCLPFELTFDQKKVFKEIWKDLKKPFQMNRLLQGEVGSGKTMIAILTILIAIDNGYQSCFMVPTEILAFQQYNYFKKMLSKTGIQIEILTGSTSTSNRNNIYQKILNGELLILIGTHSLIQEKIKFKNLGIAIIDEQQKFGVEQRYKISKNNNFPHILLMTATPIPRTLAKIIYQDINISILKNNLLGRKKVKTLHFWEEEKEKAFQIIQNQIIKGRQIYIVYPSIDENKSCKDLMNGYLEITKKFKFLKKNQIEFLHGKINSKEKESKIKNFLKGKITILVTTTVIEVGIDVPNASVILIESSHNFGLSQLHQLRGRVGRSNHQSYCILLSKRNLSLDSFLRIKKMCNTNNGLNIAKEDLKLRGLGNLLGKEQSGKKYLFINFFKSYKFIKKVILTANKFLEKNPNFILKKDSNFLFKNSLFKEIK